jgi:hypothetical protein
MKHNIARYLHISQLTPAVKAEIKNLCLATPDLVVSLILSSRIQTFMTKFNPAIYIRCGPGSSVGTATGYGVDGPGIESR